MTHPFPDGNPAPRPLSPAAPPPFSGTAPDLGLPAPTAPWYPGDPTAAPPPHSVYQPIGNLPVPAPPYPGYQPMSQQTGPRLVSPGGRLGAALIDGLLILFTAVIGWFVWALFTFRDGQTPGRQILGHVAADAATGQPLDWGRTAIREVLIKGIVGYFASALSCGVYSLVDAAMVFGDRNRTLHDRMINSIVIHK
jgi:uncharacterized RDD family membrane protein YckC